jgi:membrane protein CcdC involved in cytochrome C biogenesis
MIAFTLPDLVSLPPVRALVTLSPIAGGLAVLSWRIRETRTPVSTAKIVIPPLGMSMGFGMFTVPSMRIPLLWAVAAFLLGALVFAYPISRTSTLERRGDVVMMQRSRAFLAILLGLLAVRIALHEYVQELITPRQTAALFFVLAFGMIVRWRAGMLVQYRRLTAA